MKLSIVISVVISIFTNAVAADERSSVLMALIKVPPVVTWKRHCIDIETGMIWNVGTNTPISYLIVPTQISWRSPYIWKKEFPSGSKFVLRNQLSLVTDWVEHGPEDYYIGLSGAPSLEWWSADDKWSIYTAVGGGLGLTNSTKVTGGQGQDLTYNWFAKSGLRYQFDQSLGVYGGVFFNISLIGGQPTPIQESMPSELPWG